METKAVKGYESLYGVTENGDIFACEKIVKSGKGYKSERLYIRQEKPARLDKYGYKRVTLCKGGKLETITIHRIVATAFLEGNNKLTVNHKDGDKLNNHFSNLEFISISDNLKHAYKTGLKKPPSTKVGDNNPKAKLNAKQVRKIKSSNLSNRKLSKIYGVHHSIIGGIKNGTRYFNIK